MKIKQFYAADKPVPEIYKEVQEFIKNKKVINVEFTSGTEESDSFLVVYDDRTFKVKYFNESEYQDLSDTYARMQDAVNKFCTNHDVVKIETTQNNDEDLVTVVTYKEQLNDN